MNQSTLSTLRDPALLEVRNAHLARLESLFAGDTPERPFFLKGLREVSNTDPYADPRRWVAEALESLAHNTEESKDPDVFRPLCIEFRPYLVHFAEPMFGARPRRVEGRWWIDRIHSNIGNLQPPDLDKDPTWHLARTVAREFLSHSVTVPLFSLPTIAGSLNIASSLYGEDFFIAMLKRPAAVRHDLEVINDLLCLLNRWYLDNIPPPQLQQACPDSRCMPPGHGLIYGCTTHLLSHETYRDFIAPLDEKLLSLYPNGGMIHLCGEHTQHIPTWREMKPLRAFQINDRAADDLEIYFNELRDDQIIYLSPTPAMTVPRALEITRSRRLVIAADPPDTPL